MDNIVIVSGDYKILHLFFIFLFITILTGGGEIMGFGNFAKSEKRKKKKVNAKGFGAEASSAPVFVPPTVIPKKKKYE